MRQLLKTASKFSLVILVLAFWACEEVESLLPTVTSNFTFTNEEGSGLVKFINTSEDANKYEWDFGDGKTSTEVNPVNIYGSSGTYTVTLKAINASGVSDTASSDIELTVDVVTPPGGGECTDETEQSLDAADFNLTFLTDPGAALISDGTTYTYIPNPDTDNAVNSSCFVGQIDRDPGSQFANNQIDFDSKFDFNANTGFKLKVWAPAVGTAVLLKLEDKTNSGTFAEVSAETTTANAWEELTFDFAPGDSDKFDKIVLFFDIATDSGATYYIDDLRLYGGAGGPGGGDPTVATSFPIDFENNETISGVFEAGDGVTGNIIDNPDQSGINASAKVFEFNKANGAAWFSGLFQIFPADIDLSTTQAITFKIWSPKAGINVRVQLEKEGGGGGPTVNIDQTLATANEWVSMTYDFAGLVNVADAYDKFVVFPDFDDVGQPAGDGSIYYLDDFEQGTGSGGGGGPEPATSLPVDFENNETFSGVFEAGDGVTGMPIANPDASGINTSATVYEFNKVNGAAWYSGMFNIFPSNIDLNTGTVFTVKVWSPKAGVNVRMQLEKEGGGGGPTLNIDQTLATANTWVELTYDFSGTINVADAYDKIVIFPDFDDVGQPAGDGSIYYVDDLAQSAPSSPPAPATSFPIGFETNETLSGVFEAGDGVTGMPIMNPDQSGINTTATVFEFNKVNGAAWYSGMFNVFPSNIDLNSGTSFTFKIWSPKAGVNVRMQLEKEGGGGGPTLFVDQTVATANTWVEVTYDFTGTINVADAYDKFVIFPDFDDVGQPAGDGSIYYVDDIVQNAPAAPPSAATSLPMTFESNETFSGVFEAGDGVTGVPIANPDQSGINTSATVFEFNKVNGAAWYSGMFNVFPSNLDLNAGTTFTVKVWSPKAGINVRFQLEKEGGGGGPTLNVDQTLATANTWVELTYDFSGTINVADAYDKIVVFPDFDDVGQPAGDGSIYYVDDVIQVAPAGPSPATSFPINFESNETLSGVFEAGDGVTGVPIANPDQSGINTSANVFEFTKTTGAAWYSGMFNIFPSDIDLNSGTVFTVKMWSPKANINVRFQLEKEGGGGTPVTYQIDQNLATANTWVELTFDFTGIVNVADGYDKIVIFPDFDDVGQPAGDGSVYYVDDITQQ